MNLETTTLNGKSEKQKQILYDSAMGNVVCRKIHRCRKWISSHQGLEEE